MSSPDLYKNNLVLYKQSAARIIDIDSKRITIELLEDQQLRVRPKDITLLHPGPVRDLTELDSQSEMPPDLLAAWELLAGNKITLRELVELAYGAFTPAATWSTWQVVSDGLYFSGDPDQIIVLSAEQVRQEKARRRAREAEQKRWEDFIMRLADSELSGEDSGYLSDVEALALGQQSQSRVMRALGKEQTEQNAHDLLLEVGYWDSSVNPYPARFAVNTSSVQSQVPSLPVETRLDLTGLLSLAIDDEGNVDPDDALSWDDGRIWVHIADVAALVTPDNELDLEARQRGANLYLPEKTVFMLPPEITQQLGLGLEERSPALSFGIDLYPDGRIKFVEVVPTWVKVTRWTYEEAELRLNEPIPAKLLAATKLYQSRRQEAGAIELHLPEVRVKVQNNRVAINPILPLQSRNLVREAMLMTGEAVARFAQESDIAIPFTSQEAPASPLPEGDALSMMFATRKLLKPSQQSVTPGFHSGLGMALYAQTTSPLRRYLDLVIHQQLRAFLRHETLLSEQEIVERIGATTSIQRDLRRVEGLSRHHWTLVHLIRHPDWQGEGIVVEKHGQRCVTLLPRLDLETDLYLPGDPKLDDSLRLKIQDVNLAHLNAKFTPITSAQTP